MSDHPPKPDFGRAPAPEGHAACRVPIVEDDGQIRIDPWWGTIQPCTLAEGVGTVGELEVIAHLARGGRIIDTRRREFVDHTGLIEGATHIEWEEINEHPAAFDPDGPTVLYCNGPQCGATPNAVKLLLEAGTEPAKILYYRGGIQDWMALGLPVVAADES